MYPGARHLRRKAILATGHTMQTNAEPSWTEIKPSALFSPNTSQMVVTLQSGSQGSLPHPVV